MALVKRIHILHTNDLHSHFRQMPKIDSLVRAFKKEWAELGEANILVDIGDHLDRVNPITEGTDGQANVAILDRMDYDIITLGNNELLTFSQEALETLYSNRSFTVVSTNVVHKRTKITPSWIKPYKILILNGVRLAIFGVTIPYQTVYEEMGWMVFDPVTIIKREVEKIRNQVDMIIVLSHLGIQHDRRLAEKVPDIDIILGAHTHHILMIPEQIGNTIIAAAGKFGEFLGHITIDINVSNKSKTVEGYCIPVIGEVKNEIFDMIEIYRKQSKYQLAKIVTDLENDLPIRWNEESPLGNFLADSLRKWVGSEVAIVNSGVLLNGLSSGKITLSQLHKICPHPINPALISILGKYLRTTLEESLLKEFINMDIHGYGFRGKQLGTLCVSGMKIVYDLEGPPYHKIKSIMVGQEPLCDEIEYKVATLDMFTFGIGYTQLQNGTIIQYFLPEFLRNLLAYYLQQTDASKDCFLPRWIQKKQKK